MTKLSRSLLIQASPPRVFARVNDPLGMADWLPGMIEAHNVIGDGLGQQYEWSYKMAGLVLRGQSTVVEHIPNVRAVHQSIGTIDSAWTYTVAPDEQGTVLTIEVEYTVPLPVLGKLAEHIARRRNERELDLALVNVKEMLETEVDEGVVDGGKRLRSG